MATASKYKKINVFDEQEPLLCETSLESDIFVVYQMYPWQDYRLYDRLTGYGKYWEEV